MLIASTHTHTQFTFCTSPNILVYPVMKYKTKITDNNIVVLQL